MSRRPIRPTSGATRFRISRGLSSRSADHSSRSGRGFVLEQPTAPPLGAGDFARKCFGSESNRAVEAYGLVVGFRFGLKSGVPLRYRRDQRARHSLESKVLVNSNVRDLKLGVVYPIADHSCELPLGEGGREPAVRLCVGGSNALQFLDSRVSNTEREQLPEAGGSRIGADLFDTDLAHSIARIMRRARFRP